MSPSPVGRVRVWHSQTDTKPTKAELHSPGDKGLGRDLASTPGMALLSKAHQAPRPFITVGSRPSSVYVLKVKAWGQLRPVWCSCRLVVTDG